MSGVVFSNKAHFATHYSADPGDIVDLNELIPDALADGQVLTNGVPRSKRTETHNLVARRRRRSSLLSRRQRNEGKDSVCAGVLLDDMVYYNCNIFVLYRWSIEQ